MSPVAESRCKSDDCRALLFWARTATGARIPLNVDPQRRVVLERPDCPVSLAEPCSCPGAGHVAVATIVTTYTPHHETCPDADRFRRPA